MQALNGFEGAVAVSEGGDGVCVGCQVGHHPLIVKDNGGASCVSGGLLGGHFQSQLDTTVLSLIYPVGLRGPQLFEPRASVVSTPCCRSCGLTGYPRTIREDQQVLG